MTEYIKHEENKKVKKPIYITNKKDLYINFIMGFINGLFLCNAIHMYIKEHYFTSFVLILLFVYGLPLGGLTNGK